MSVPAPPHPVCLAVPPPMVLLERRLTGNKELRRNRAGMLGAAMLQNTAVFVRRQLISRNTADILPGAIQNLSRLKWLAGLRSNKVFFFFLPLFLFILVWGEKKGFACSKKPKYYHGEFYVKLLVNVASL